MYVKYCIYLSLILFIVSCQNQKKDAKLGFEISTLDPIPNASLRGLFVLDDRSFWVSGSNGTATYVRISDDQVSYASLEGYEHKDFRDIHAFNENEAVILSVGDSAIFLRTENKWKTIDTVYYDFQPGVFIDAMDFDDEKGLSFGDALNDEMYMVESSDYGKSWERVSPQGLPTPLSGEGGFAASGTNVVLINGNSYVGSGAGSYPRFFKKDNEGTWNHSRLPLQSGPLNGVYSVSFKNISEGVVIGGSFQDSTRNDSVAAFTVDGGKHWTLSNIQPGGFRSCVAYSAMFDIYLACGRTGIDISKDGGNSWENISGEGGFYACGFGQQYAILVGRRGKIARIKFFHET